MCGIAGLLHPTSPVPELRAIAARMADRLVHRGPDAYGIWGEEGVALSHRRLAIMDISHAGAQPMLSSCGRFAMVFNGEIYNHLDLRRDLAAESAAPDWAGHSDTETLLAAIVFWGLDEALRRSSGMFALALWDRFARRLLLARDRMGEKPLYWGWAGEALVFGSELKALRAHPISPKAICPEALTAYLARGYVPAPYSIHPGIYKLEPGCLLEVYADSLPATAPPRPVRPNERHGGLSIRRYWSLDAVIAAGAADPFSDDAAALAATETTLTAAIARQTLADVPLGAFLSGGVDSSLIVALMQAQSAKRVQTFTVGFEAQDYDESPFAAAVAAHLGTDHTALRLTEAEARETVPILPDLYDEPFADSSQIPTHLVCRTARGAVSVALSGDGGDELFGGYNRYILGPRLWRRLALTPFMLRRGIGTAALALPQGIWDKLGRLHARVDADGSEFEPAGQKIRRIAKRLQQVRSADDLYFDTTALWPDPAPLLVVGATGPAFGPLFDPLPDCLAHDPAGRMMALDLRSYLPDDILCKVDRAAMGISLETRVPFLDPAVIELSSRLKPEQKIRDGQGKWVLREVLYRHVPRALLDRPKTGFSIPLAAWLRGPLRPWAEDLLSLDSLARDSLLASETIRAAWDDHLSGRADRSAQLWIILMFLAWKNSCE
jgi:asparagine synthase (glutamine-hydrolysing)